MLPVSGHTVRIALHVLAATVWIGGQITLAGLVPVVRRLGPEATSAVARRFQVLAWPAFGLLVATGVWNVLEIGLGDVSSEWLTTFSVKMALVLASAVGAGAHALFAGPRALRTGDPDAARRARAVSGAAAGIGLLAGVGAVFLGVML